MNTYEESPRKKGAVETVAEQDAVAWLWAVYKRSNYYKSEV